jgi:hypothetical protein
VHRALSAAITRSARGQSLAEFAIVLLPLVLLTYVSSGLGDLARIQSTVDVVAREAAVVSAAVRPSGETDQQTLLQQAQERAQVRAKQILDDAHLSASAAQVDISGDFSAGGGPGEPAIVTARVTYTHVLSPVARAVLRPWFPTGVVSLSGVAHERMPRYISR